MASPRLAAASLDGRRYNIAVGQIDIGNAMTDLAARMESYELAFRMQTSLPELTNFSTEPKEILELYGLKEPGDGSFASNCLLARRLAERGVRFIQLYHRAWDLGLVAHPD